MKLTKQLSQEQYINRSVSKTTDAVWENLTEKEKNKYIYG